MSLQVPDFTPEHVLFVDWETYYDSDYTLQKLTTCDYVRDIRFETIGVGIDDGEESVWLEEHEFLNWAKTVPWDRTAVVMHNAQFDAFILSQRYGIHPAVILCTMSMARTFGIDGGVSLAKCAEHFGVGVKGHEVLQAKGKRREDFTQGEWLRYGEYCQNDVALTKAIYEKMTEQGFPEAELWLIDATCKMFTNPKLILDEPLLSQYLIDERKRKAGMLERIAKDKSIVLSNEKFAQALLELGAEPQRKVSLKTGKETWAFAKTDVGMQNLLEDENDEIRWLAEARVALKSTINETRTERFLRICSGGNTLPVYLRYAAAHTYRWGGGDKTNLQNLQRTNKKKPERGTLKKALLAPAGHKVVAVDSGAIEARTLAWLAGHDELVAGFRENRDVYSEFASEIYGRHVDRKANPDDEVPGFVAKICVLGLGYQLGFPKLSDIFLKGAMGGPPVQFTETDAQTMGVNLTRFYGDERKLARVAGIVSRLDREALLVHCAVCEFIVRKYRKANAPITAFWETAGEVIEAMVTLEGDDRLSFGPGECLQVVRHGIVLPNGLTLRYPGLRESEDGEGYSYLGQYGKQRVNIYGGLVCENITQAMARIVVGEQMLSAQAKYGYQASLMTHDEIVVVVPEEEASLALHRLIEEMKTPPSWALDLPLTAEGGYARSLGGCK